MRNHSRSQSTRNRFSVNEALVLSDKIIWRARGTTQSLLRKYRLSFESYVSFQLSLSRTSPSTHYLCKSLKLGLKYFKTDLFNSDAPTSLSFGQHLYLTHDVSGGLEIRNLVFVLAKTLFALDHHTDQDLTLYFSPPLTLSLPLPLTTLLNQHLSGGALPWLSIRRSTSPNFRTMRLSRYLARPP